MNTKQLLTTALLLLLAVISVSAQGIPFIRNYNATEYKAHNQNFDIITGEDGTVYVANFEGLLYYDHSRWGIIYTPGVTRLTAVFRDSKGTIWTGGYNYIGYVKHDKQGRLFLHATDEGKAFQGEVQWIWEKDEKIFFLVSDSKIYTVINDDVQWAAGAQLPQSGFSVFVEQAHINQIQELDDGLKAVATSGSGIIITDAEGHEMMRITEDNGLCSNNVSHITYNKKGLIWGATDNGIFAIAYPSIYTHLTPNEGLRGEVTSIARMGQHIYAGTLSGLYRLNGHHAEPVREINHACWQLTRQGPALLAATSNGVYRINPDNSVRQLSTQNTMALLVDNNGYYSGEMDGVYFNTEAGTKKVSDVEKVMKLVKDPQLGTIWMQNLYGKLWRAFQPYDIGEEKDDIATLVVYQNKVVPVCAHTTTPFTYPTFSYADTLGVTWLTNNKGRKIYAFYDGNKEKTLSKAVHPLMDYSVRAMLREDNTLWMGGDKGINIVSNAQSEKLELLEKPRLMLRAVLLHGDSVLWGGYGEQPKELPALSSNDHHVTIHYATENFSLLLRTQFRTRMDGSRWSAWDTDKYEEYANLSSGDHTFEVQARDAFGQLSDIVSLNISIDYPFYLRWYMILLYVILLLLAAYAIFQWRLQKLEKDKHRLESLVKERTTEVVRLEKMATVGKLTQGLIDRILNPLNYINNFAKLSEGLIGDVKANIEDEQEHMDPDNYDDTMDVLDMLKGNLQKVGEHGASTTRTLKAMEEMLKDRSGGFVKMDLIPLLQQDEEMLKKYYEKEIAQYGISVAFTMPTGELHINGNPEQLSKMFMNLLGNSIYAVVKKVQRQQQGAAYKPEIRLSTEVTGKQATLRFHDNGTGIEKNNLEKIFDPFFTTKTTGEASGIGLYLCHEIAQNHGGTITVQSEKNEYTEFTITLPTL